MDKFTSPKDMTEAEKSQITTAAFCAYIMLMRGCKQEEALKVMGALTSQTQVALYGPRMGIN